MDSEAFMSTAWADHAEQAEAVALRLAEASTQLAAADLAAWARLWVHVTGEHLGQWERGIAELARLRLTADAGAATIIERSIATLRLARGEAGAEAALADGDRIIALATASAALAGRNDFARALELLDDALRRADAGPVGGAGISRALAVAGNNIAAALEEKADRSAFETAGMLRAARAGLMHWSACGGWLETERAAFRLANSALLAGETEEAEAAARQCVDICTANDADAFECFFAHAMHARTLHAAGDSDFRVARSAALACRQAVPDDQAQWCESEEAALAALPA